MSLLGTLKGAIFEDEVPKAGPPPARDPMVVTPPGGAQAAAAADPNALAKLEARLKREMPPAFTTFLEKVAELAEVIPDESMRFKAAMKTSHTTPAELAQALEHLAGVLTAARTEFLNTFQATRESASSAKQQQLSATEATIVTREGQIKAIQEEIASLRAKIETDRREMQAEEHRLETIHHGFEAAHHEVASRIQAQMASLPKG